MRTRNLVVLLMVLAGMSLEAWQTRAGRSGRRDVTTEGNWRKFQDPFSKSRGNCPDCRAGEGMAQSVMAVPPGAYVNVDDPPCDNARFKSPHIPNELKSVAAAAFRAQDASGQLGVFALGFDDTIITSIAKATGNDAGSLGQLTRDVTRQPQVASCVRAIVALPRIVRITRIDARMDCPAGGWCRNEPATTDELDNELFAVSSVGKNWSHNRGATMILRVFYMR